jgi:hypothetical protein
VYGIVGLVVVYGLLRVKRWAWQSALAISSILIAWMLFEIALMGLTAPIQMVMALLGVLMLGLVLLPSVRDYFEQVK